MPKFNKEKTNKLEKIDRFFRAVYLSPKNNKDYPPIDKNSVDNILIIGFFLIGDTIMYLPALRTVKNNVPNARITLVCEKQTEIVLQGQGLIDEFVIIKCPWIIPTNYSIKNLMNFFGSLRQVNHNKYGLAIDFRGDWRNIFYMNFAKASRKVDYNFSGGQYMLTDVVEPKDNIVHFTEEAFYLLKKIGCSFTEADKIPVLKLTEQASDFIEQFKRVNNLVGRLIIGVHPGSSQEVKKWAEAKYGELITRLSTTYSNTTFLIFEGPGEQETIAKLTEQLKANNIIDYLVVKRSLAEYVQLISICNLMVCNDSGAAHIAGAYGVSTLIIFGNVDPIYVTPYGPKIKKVISHSLECKPCYQSFCKYGHNLCIAGVTVEEVYNPIVEMISKIKVAAEQDAV